MAFRLNLRDVRFETQVFNLDAAFGGARSQIEFTEPIFAAFVIDAARRAVETQAEGVRILRLRLGGRLRPLNFSVDTSRMVFDVDCASGESREQARRIDNDGFRFRPDIMQAVQIRPAPPVNLVEEIRAFDLDFFDHDSAAHLQRVQVGDFDQRVGAFDRGDELSRPIVVDFQVAEPRRLRVPAYAEASDLDSRPEFAERGFDLSRHVAVEIFGSDIEPGAHYEDRHEQDCARDRNEVVLESAGARPLRRVCYQI